MQLLDRFQIQHAQIRVVCSDRTLEGSRADYAEAAQGAVRSWRWEGLTVAVTCDEEQIHTVAVQNSGSRDLHLRHISLEWRPTVAVQQPDARDYVQLYHPQTFELAGVRPLHRPNDWSDPADASSMVTVLSRRLPGEALLLGALPPYGDCFVSFPILHASPHRDGAFGLSIRLTAPRSIAAGDQLVLAHLIARHGEDGIELLSQYAELLRARLPEALNSKPRITGWNSWDYYAGAVAEQDVVENARAARERFGDAIRYVVIDEGYESQWGVWEAGWKFPAGLQALCAEIREAGCEPGIWTAPLMVNVYTPLFRDNPTWFVSDEEGNPYSHSSGYGSMVMLDMTKPEVQQHIREVFTALRQAGFTYFKCDFTQLLLGASRFFRDDLSHAGQLRELFRLIRESIGENAYLLACGAPFESVIGIADAHRTTGDVHHYWSHIRQNIRTMQARWWMQGAVGNTDPDFVIVRCESTTDDTKLSRRLPKKPWKRGGNFYAGREMNLEEAKTLLLASYLSGGDIVLSDALRLLNETGLTLLSTVLQEQVERGVPINLFAYDGDDFPVVVAQGKGRKLLALFNLSDDYVPRRLPQPYAGLIGPHEEFWSKEPIDVLEQGEMLMAPHSAKAWWVAATF